eukprot:c8381_g1_i2.p1 GENE.c8381_g1_i2~~c8381_g1_i2.p1  ORF type:complete len:279 (-),score=50.98 c8381_g1_i2:119-955(-)
MRRAASVILVRNANPGFQVLLIERSSKLTFAGSMHVFPGGVIDNTDIEAAQLWGVDALKVAAFREVFEETGLNLTNQAIPFAKRIEWAHQIRESPGKIVDFFQAHNIQPQPHINALHQWCRFVTPSAEPKRFDTYFYVAHLQNQQRMTPDGQETVAGHWLSIDEAIERCEAGTLPMLPPQWMILQSLRHFKSSQEIITAAQNRPISQSNFPIQPHFVHEGLSGERPKSVMLVLPGDEKHTPEENAYTGAPGSIHRLVCPVPLGKGYRLIENHKLSAML